MVRSPLQTSVWLALVLIAVKAAALGALRPAYPMTKAPMATAKDVLFALCAGLTVELVVRALHRWPSAARGVSHAFVVFCAACSIYAVIALGVFDYFGRQLTYDMLLLIKDAGAVRSSITERLTIPVACALVAAPALFLAASLRLRLGARTLWILVLGGFAWSAFGARQYAVQPLETHSRCLAMNPHAELLRSTFSAITRQARTALPRDYPAEDALEFRTFAARGDSPRASFPLPSGIARPRNVIVVVLESVGTKYLSFYGSPLNVMPNLAAETSHALVFENIYAHAPYTWGSFIAINFSIYPGLPWFFAGTERQLPPPLASAMQQRGARTAYLHNGDLDWAATRWMLSQGGYEYIAGYSELGCPPLTSWGTEDRCLFDRLIGWIEEKPTQPFHAYCWTDQTHDPYALPPGTPVIDFFAGQPPPPLAAELTRYLTVLHETDKQLGRLFAFLRARGLADDTLVVVTGDHGEAFREPHEQRGHSLTLYEEEVRVPLVIWNPRLFPSGGRSAAIGGLVDLNPTLADLLGIEPGREWQGHSLFDTGRPQRTFFMAHAAEYLFGLREDRWKYIFDATNSAEMLFDLHSDPREQRNLAAREPALSRRMRQRIAAWVAFEEEFLHNRAPAVARAPASHSPR